MTLLEFNPKWHGTTTFTYLQGAVERVEYSRPWEHDSFITVSVKFRNANGVLLSANMWIPEYSLYVTMEQAL